MALTGGGLTFDTFLNEFGQAVFGGIDEFGLYVDSIGEQTFELLAESVSDALLTLSVNSATTLPAVSLSYGLITFTLSAEFIDSLLAESVSDVSLILNIEGLLELLAESSSDGILGLDTVPPSTTSMLAESASEVGAFGSFSSTFSSLAESLSESITDLKAYYTISLLAESLSEAIISNIHGDGEVIVGSLLAESLSEAVMLPLFNIKFNILSLSSSSSETELATLFSTTVLVASNDNYCFVFIPPQEVGYLGYFSCLSNSDLSVDIYTYDYIITDPLTEEGFCVSDNLTEFGEMVICPLSDSALTISSKHVFYEIYRGIVVRLSGESQARTKLRYQYFQYPYIIIFDSNYNLVSVEDIITGKFIEVKDNNRFVLDINI